MRHEESETQALRAGVDSVPKGTVGILPHRPAGESWSIIQRIGLAQRATVLSPAQLIDPEVFNPRQMPVALYLDGEDYLRTVRKSGDAANALVRYVHEGGTLVLLPSGPWPLFYADGPGFHRPEPLTERLGLPLFVSFESAPADHLSVKVASGQSIVKLDRMQFPFPMQDPRFRGIERTRISSGAKYTPIASVTGNSGKDYGDAAALLEFPSGGRILYIACNLTRDPDYRFAITEAVIRFALSAVHRR
jgi:hypothetical protein